MLRGKVYAILIICIAFFMSGGLSQVMGETLPAEPEIIEVIEVELIKVTKPEFIEATDPDILAPFVSSDGLTKRGGKQKSVEQIMCGPSNGLPTPKECWYKGQ